VAQTSYILVDCTRCKASPVSKRPHAALCSDEHTEIMVASSSTESANNLFARIAIKLIDVPALAASRCCASSLRQRPVRVGQGRHVLTNERKHR
jgi:hypothetical protein